MADATIINTTTASVDASTGPLTINVPTNIDGDYLLTFIACAVLDTITVPTGWTLLLRTDSTTTASLASYVRTAASEPASYDWSVTNSTRWAMGCSSARHIDPAARVNISGATGGAAQSVSMVGPTITTTRNKCLLIHAGTIGAATSGMTATPPAAMAEIVDKSTTNASANRILSVSWVLLGDAGATGTKTATGSNSGPWAAQMIALNPFPATQAGIRTSMLASTVDAGKLVR